MSELYTLGIKRAAKELLEIDQQEEAANRDVDGNTIWSASHQYPRNDEESRPDKKRISLGGDNDDIVPQYHDPPHDQETQTQPGKLSRWLRINLVLCNVTVWLMFVISVVEIAFAELMREEIANDDDYHQGCREHYVYAWFVDSNHPARNLGKECGTLYAWTIIMIIGGSFCIVRTLSNALRVHSQNYWTFRYRPGSTFDRLSTPSRTYAFRTFLSATALVLHIPSAIILGISPVIQDKEPADFVYHIMYILCLAIICTSSAMLAQQVYATGLASWRLKDHKRWFGF